MSLNLEEKRHENLKSIREVTCFMNECHECLLCLFERKPCKIAKQILNEDLKVND